MSNKPPRITWIIAGLFGLSTLFNVFFVLQQMMIERNLQDLQGQIAAGPPLGQLEGVTRALLNDLAGYTRADHQWMAAVLQKYGFTVQMPPPAAPHPSTGVPR